MPASTSASSSSSARATRPQALDYLRATGSVEEVGTEEIGGVETTHYQGSIMLDSVVEQVPADQQEAVRKAIEKLKKQTGLTEIPVDVWVDGDGLLRRMSLDVHRQGAGRAARRRTLPRP